ncbi:protein of unknown function [Taphrina deformans PYCC 5710]|uniref:U3 small nucleolar RNA-associated protein 15 C-terminal domain-containing protein n=1 Tax=Taphrina deformans (strain PYCC 5710 / ATCC 11124 / CBS 356.35 / IMI 108563 / JCM 9778 / NBRC 8474) TaxID=1097556 RepID=R4XCT7_TAPDE|nr:protein of unknown function [Taphrina deformans PYCC 5710]|eukprot:CCG83675.1 protein of unknown function [Taphrina deformans PYCC 5710]
MSTELPRIATTKFPALPSSISAESRYWRKYKSPIIVKEYAAVSHIHFSPVSPHDFAVSASTRIQIYSSKTRSVAKTISRFSDITFGAEFRKDGKLLVSGDATGLVQIFDANSRSILRSIDIHKLPTHVSKFSPHDLTTIITASDDKTIRIWDIPTQKPINTFKGHTDYVRTAEFMTSSPSLYLSGSYDGTVRLWDARVSERGGEVQTLSHEANVERVLPVSGTTVTSAGGSDVRVWDLSSGSQRPLKILQNHAKGVSCLAKTSSNSRLLSGGLDGHLKIYDTTEWKVLHSVKYPHPILSTGISQDDKHLVVGMSNGLLSIRTRSTAPSSTADPSIAAAPPPRKVQKFLRGATHRPTLTDTVVDETRGPGLRKWDKCIRRYAYADALDAVLKSDPTTIHAVLSTLKRRSGLIQALSQRDDTSLVPILRFLIRQIKDVRMANLCIDVTMVVLELYGGALGASQETGVLLYRLDEQVRGMVGRAKEAVKVDGMLQMLFVAA